jgi:hypothetical protein
VALGRGVRKSSEPQAIARELRIGNDGHRAFLLRDAAVRAEYAVNREAKGLPYAYRATARFEGSRGTGKRIDLRPCDLSFTKG